MSIVNVFARVEEIKQLISAVTPAADGGSAVTGETKKAAANEFASAIAAASQAQQASGVTVKGDGALLTGEVSGEDIVEQAKSYIGVPYVFGGEDRSGMDCSGLVQRVLADLGIDAPRVVQDQQHLGEEVPSLAEAKPGDLLVYKDLSHIVIYAGDGKVIHAPYPGKSVEHRSNWLKDSDLLTIRRVAPSEAEIAAKAAPASAPAAAAQAASALAAAAPAVSAQSLFTSATAPQTSFARATTAPVAAAAAESAQTAPAATAAPLTPGAASTAAATIAAAPSATSAAAAPSATSAAAAASAAVTAAASGTAASSAAAAHQMTTTAKTAAEHAAQVKLTPAPAAEQVTAPSTPQPQTVNTPAPVASTAPASAPLAQQVSVPVMNLARAGNGEHTLTIQVTPENLGPVTVKALISNGAIHIELVSATDAGRDALRSILTDLRRDLAVLTTNSSLQLGSSDASTSQQSQNPFSSSGSAADNGRGSSQGTDRQPTQTPGQSTPAQPEQTPASVVNAHGGGIDLFS